MEVTVYIVKCADGSYYTGLTKQELQSRLWEHNAGIYRGYTFKRRPVELVFSETYDRIVDAHGSARSRAGRGRRRKR
jgi:putative endonuclease